jgi:hypothetical protein
MRRNRDDTRAFFSERLWRVAIPCWIALAATAALTEGVREQFQLEARLLLGLRLALLQGSRPVATHVVRMNSQLGEITAALCAAGLTALLWLLWQWMAATRIRRLSGRLRFSPWMGLVAWIVPGLDAVLVPAAYLELFTAADPEQGTPDRAPRWTAAFVLVWWGLFVTAVAMVTRAIVDTPRGIATVPLSLHHDVVIDRSLRFVLYAAVAAAVLLWWITYRVAVKEMRMKSQGRRAMWTAWREDAAPA